MNETEAETAEFALLVVDDTTSTSPLLVVRVGTESARENVVRKAKLSNGLPVVRAGNRIETSSATPTHTAQPAPAVTPARVAVHHDAESDHVRDHLHVVESQETVADAEAEAEALLESIGTYLADLLLLPLLPAKAKTTTKRHANALGTKRQIQKRSPASQQPASGTNATDHHRARASETNATVRQPARARAATEAQTAEDGTTSVSGVMLALIGGFLVEVVALGMVMMIDHDDESGADRGRIGMCLAIASGRETGMLGGIVSVRGTGRGIAMIEIRGGRSDALLLRRPRARIRSSPQHWQHFSDVQTGRRTWRGNELTELSMRAKSRRGLEGHEPDRRQGRQTCNAIPPPTYCRWLLPTIRYLPHRPAL